MNRRRWLLAACAATTVILAGVIATLYVQSPGYSLRRLAAGLENRDLQSVQKYADIIGVADNVKAALALHAMMASPHSRWTPAHELAMSPAASPYVMADAIRLYIERVSDGVGPQSLYLLDPSAEYVGLSEIHQIGSVAVATALIRYADVQDPVAVRIALRKRDYHWQVMNVALDKAEETLIQAHRDEIHAAFEADPERLERETQEQQTSTTSESATTPVTVAVPQISSEEPKPPVVAEVEKVPRRHVVPASPPVATDTASENLENVKRDAAQKGFVFAIVRGANGENRFDSERVFHEPSCPSVTLDMRAGPRRDAVAAGYTPAWDCHRARH